MKLLANAIRPPRTPEIWGSVADEFVLPHQASIFGVLSYV